MIICGAWLKINISFLREYILCVYNIRAGNAIHGISISPQTAYKSIFIIAHPGINSCNMQG